MTTRITTDNITDGTIVKSDLGTIANNTISWQVVTADGSTNTTAEAGKGYFIDTTSATHTINLPASPSVGDTVHIRDYAGTFNTNNVTVGRNSSNIGGSATDGLLSTNNSSFVYVYSDSTKGWLTLEGEAQNNPLNPEYISATGGTETTSGDFKIHTFTSSGCFVVSSLGNPTGGGDTVNYLVVAGGGGGEGSPGSGGKSGGGAGGLRTNYPSPTTAGLPVSAQTYPITVGSGGAGASGSPAAGGAGSTSTFSTITSAGGGSTGGAGGSGAGGPYGQGTGGAGNTPPVSPPQGNPGGTGAIISGGNTTSGGGGGKGSAGQNGPAAPTRGGNGGSGEANSITGSSVTYAGGGSGGGEISNSYSPNPYSAPGGGGNGSGGAGTTNRGSGGGAGQPSSGAGGSGIVILRYKYQN